MTVSDETLTAGCRGCQATFRDLDEVVDHGVLREPGLARMATLHVLAAVCSWWASRVGREFSADAAGRAGARSAVMRCLANVFAEQGWEPPR